MNLTPVKVYGLICQWPNDYPVPGIDPALENCNHFAAFDLHEHGYSARVCMGHAIAELLRTP